VEQLHFTAASRLYRSQPTDLYSNGAGLWFSASSIVEQLHFIAASRLYRSQPTDLYSNGAGLSPNHSHHSIEPAAPELRRTAVLTLELRLVELIEVRNGT
jgi:hypothetical protein